MTNREKFEIDLEDIKFGISKTGVHGCDFIRKNILDECNGIASPEACHKCSVLFMIWLFSEAKEENIEWDKIEQGKTIEVSENGKDWVKRKFVATYKGKIVANVDDLDISTHWEYGRLIKDNKNGENK